MERERPLLEREETGEQVLQAAVATATEIADSQTSLTRARQGLTRAVAQLEIAWAELRLAVGGQIPAGRPKQEVTR